MTFKDIAEVLGVSENTAKTKFYRSLNKLESSIYEVEKKEGVRLHSIGVVPFLLFMYMLYSKSIPVSANMIDEVTKRVDKEIDSAKGNGNQSKVSKSPVTKVAGAKTGVLSAKAIGIVIAVIVVAGGIVAGVIAFINTKKPDSVNTNTVSDNNSELVVEVDTETETETESENDVQNVLENYYDDTLVSQFGIADKTFVRNYSFTEGNDDEDMSKDYIDTNGNPGLAGKTFVDIDGDDEVEMLVGNVVYNDTVMNAQILIYDYDDVSKSVNEITDGKIKSYDFGWCNDTVQFAYQQKNDGFYIYTTDMYTYTWYEGGYRNAIAYSWKVDSNGVTEILNADSYGEMYMDERDFMNVAKNSMPTIVDQWYEKYDDIDNLIVGNFKEIPLIKSLSDMDTEYTEIMYIGVGRSEESTTWEYEYDMTNIPGFTIFYE